MADGPDRAGFADFFTGTWPRLYRTVYGITLDRDRTDDALQSAYAKALAAWPKVQAADDPVAYVRRMAVNEALGVYRRSWFRRELMGAVPEVAVLAEHETFGHRDEVWRAVTALPPRQRAVVVLRYYEGLSEAEIAEVLGCRPGTVKSHASGALARLRVVLGESDVTLEGDLT